MMSSPMPVYIEGYADWIGEGVTLAWSLAIVLSVICVVLGVALTLAVLTRR